MTILSAVLRIFNRKPRDSRVCCTYEEVATVREQEESTTLSLLPEDVMGKQIMPFLKLKDVVRLDSALASHFLRNYFHASLRKVILHDTIDYPCLEWCRAREFSAKTLRVTSVVDDTNLLAVPHFEELCICATAKLSANALSRLLMNGKDFKTLNFQSFYTVRSHHLLPLGLNLPLLEINASGNTHMTEELLVRLTEFCPLLRVLNLLRCCHFTTRLLLALAESCPHLYELKMSARNDFGDVHPLHYGYDKLFQNCKQLQTVEFGGDFTDVDLQTMADGCRQLTSVTVRFRRFLGWNEPHLAFVDTALTALVQNNTSIHTFDLTAYYHLGDAGLLDVAQCLPDLHTFVLTNCQASLLGLSAIREHCKKLTTFEVYKYRCPVTFGDIVIYSYVQLSILSTLSINVINLTAAQLVDMAQANPGMQCLRIYSSEALQGEVLTPNALCEALRHLPNLEKLCVGIYVFPNYHSLCLRLEDSVLYALVQYCPKLTNLHLSHHANLSNTALSGLSVLTKLRVLYIDGCDKLLDGGLTAIVKGCSLLEHVNVSRCARITNVSINALARCCRKLTTVELEKCHGIRNSAIQDLIRRAPHLQMLNISENPQLTFAAVAELPKYCFCMQRLHLYGYSVTRKPILLEFYAAYRNHRRYFDIVFGWSEELRYTHR